MIDRKTELQSLIDNPCKPNPSEWAMNCKEALQEYPQALSEATTAINNTISHNGAFQQYTDTLVAIMKSIYREHYDAISVPPIKHRNQVFVAMQFNDEQERIYKEVLTPIVQSANYAIVKVNDQEYEGSIIGKIVDDITDSTMLIADLTGNRGGVYYELGIAKGLQLCNHPIKTIITCKKSFFDTEKVHFDVQGDNIILYESDEDYREKLTRRIEAFKD